jgi:hypothetical protein
MLNPPEVLGRLLEAAAQAAASEFLQVDLKLVKKARPLVELRSDGIFAIEKFPDAMMVGII